MSIDHDKLLALCAKARELQSTHYGDACGLHLDMIDWAKEYDSALAQPANDKSVRLVRFIGINPLEIGAGATEPMLRDSWRFAFSEGDDGVTRFSFNDNGSLVATAATAQPAEAVEGATLPDEGAYFVKFDDAEREDVLFVGAGAKDCALRYYEQISGSWNAHLFAKIDSNSRDCTTPNASFGNDAAQGAVARVALRSDPDQGTYLVAEWLGPLPEPGELLFTHPQAAPAQGDVADVALTARRLLADQIPHQITKELLVVDNLTAGVVDTRIALAAIETALRAHQQAAPAQGDGWRLCYSAVIHALAAIVNIRCPDKLFDLDAIPRGPVMDQVVLIRETMDRFGKELAAAPS